MERISINRTCPVCAKSEQAVTSPQLVIEIEVISDTRDSIPMIGPGSDDYGQDSPPNEQVARCYCPKCLVLFYFPPEEAKQLLADRRDSWIKAHRSNLKTDFDPLSPAEVINLEKLLQPLKRAPKTK
jgi:hypothetical protein